MTGDLMALYGHKIVSADAVARKLGAAPRAAQLAMCHGTFDLVHPGHIRHLLWARQQADLLLVSLTADRHVKKADRRPHVPQRQPRDDP